VRTLTLDNGAQIVEQLESMAETLPRTLSYSIVTSPQIIKGIYSMGFEGVTKIFGG
jgi:hypothetical protein